MCLRLQKKSPSVRRVADKKDVDDLLIHTLAHTDPHKGARTGEKRTAMKRGRE